MIGTQKIIVVMPAYNAEKTLAKTISEIDRKIVDQIILVDDFSTDKTVEIAEGLDILVIKHDRNRGYGGNQKSCYEKALKEGADFVVMVHPDYQYSPKLIPAMACMLVSGHYDIILGSRIIDGGAKFGGMPTYKYFANRLLTAFQNLFTGMKLTEFHTGYRAYSKKVLETLPLKENSEDFIFDNEILLQSHFFGFQIGELSCPCRYFPEASSINFSRSVKYGLGCIWVTALYLLAVTKIYSSSIFRANQKDRLDR